MQQAINRALETGFTQAASLDCATLRFLPEVREMCGNGACRQYNKSWVCPPACGTVEQCAERAAGYREGIIVQTMTTLEDEFDIEGMLAAQGVHQRNFSALHTLLLPDYPGLLPMGAGSCYLCEVCTYPDAPCRHPGRAFPSMEAYGLLVSDVCAQNGLAYYYGPGTMAYVSCFLLR